MYYIFFKTQNKKEVYNKSNVKSLLKGFKTVSQKKCKELGVTRDVG